MGLKKAQTTISATGLALPQEENSTSVCTTTVNIGNKMCTYFRQSQILCTKHRSAMLQGANANAPWCDWFSHKWEMREGYDASCGAAC